MMSSYDDGFRGTTPPSAARVGADLRAARERLGWTLPSVAGYLRIRLPFLEAIEDGRTADLPGNAYAVGFLRTYAQSLGLDPDEVARRFRAEAAEANQKTELNFPAPVPERGIPAGAIVLVGAVLAVGAYIGWYKMSGTSRPTTEAVQQVPDRLAPLIGKVTPPATSATQGHPAIATTEPSLPPMPAVSPSSAAAAVAPAGFASASPSTTSGATATTMVAALPPPSEPVRLEGPRIMVRAKADAWIQVREKTGQVVFNRVLRGGESWQVPAKPGLLLTTGNAGGTELVVDGVPAASLGADGVVRRDLPLDPDAIKDGKLAVSQAAAPASATGTATRKPQ